MASWKKMLLTSYQHIPRLSMSLEQDCNGLERARGLFFAFRLALQLSSCNKVTIRLHEYIDDRVMDMHTEIQK